MLPGGCFSRPDLLPGRSGSKNTTACCRRGRADRRHRNQGRSSPAYPERLHQLHRVLDQPHGTAEPVWRCGRGKPSLSHCPRSRLYRQRVCISKTRFRHQALFPNQRAFRSTPEGAAGLKRKRSRHKTEWPLEDYWFRMWCKGAQLPRLA